jgi:hypothetical protein
LGRQQFSAFFGGIFTVIETIYVVFLVSLLIMVWALLTAILYDLWKDFSRD